MLTAYALVESIWLVLPAYAANGLAPLVGKRKNLHMMDSGRKLGGKPLLGPGKTWEGLLFGAFMGTVIAAIEMLAFPYLPWDLSPVTLALVPMSPLLGLLLGGGAMLGDAAGAFVKRRLGLPRGSPAPLLDQLDFLAGALLLASLLVQLRIEWVVLLAIITPVIHLSANVIAYGLRIKKEPW
jgi:CDP-2,3-bis-(O-geranylgeranyl)-sn-glycerol synthase